MLQLKYIHPMKTNLFSVFYRSDVLKMFKRTMTYLDNYVFATPSLSNNGMADNDYYHEGGFITSYYRLNCSKISIILRRHNIILFRILNMTVSLYTYTHIQNHFSRWKYRTLKKLQTKIIYDIPNWLLFFIRLTLAFGLNTRRNGNSIS